jgi:hypothetical protein
MPEVEILNEYFFPRTNPRVQFEKNFRRVAFSLQKTTRPTMRKTVATTKSQEFVKLTVDNSELRSRRDIGTNKELW